MTHCILSSGSRIFISPSDTTFTLFKSPLISLQIKKLWILPKKLQESQGLANPPTGGTNQY